MDEKQEILERITPRAVLKALTTEALEAVPIGQRIDEFIVIRKYPFRIGRESRVRTINGKIERLERPLINNQEPNNNLYLIDQGPLLNISREHLSIEKDGSNYVLVDRGSNCGTRVGGNSVGGEDNGGSSVLNDGDVIAIGTLKTPFLYRFICLDE
ncbi:MAG: FHA domain-containing protein [Desulfobulbaceae bacterium]|nr:FHA domain-containing protein [Desulfobulbaceae bacterium]